MRIGVIDSGIGGLTVLKSLINKCPNHEYIYFGDTYHLPYGEKTKEQIVAYTNKIIEFLEEKEIDIIILACGSISSNKEHLKSNSLVIDIISPLKGKLDNYNKISIMATSHSIKTNEFKKYINSELNLIPCSKLVPIIESNDYNKLDKVLKDYLESAKESAALILGCTHYPLIKDYIKKYFNKDIICLDTYIVDIIKDIKESKYSLKLYFSEVNDLLVSNVKRILGNDNLCIVEVNLC